MTSYLTATEVRRQRSQLRRELERDLKVKDRAKLKRLRELVKSAKAHKKERVADIVKLCQRQRRRNRDIAKAVRLKHREEANKEIDRMRARSRAQCTRNKDKAKHRGLDSVVRAATNLEEERLHQRRLRIWQAPVRAGPKQTRRPTKAAVAEAEEHEVLTEIPDELVPVWHAVKSRIKATPHSGRSEVFLEWAAEHAGEVYGIQEKQLEKDVAHLVREEAQMRAEMEPPSSYGEASDAALMKRYEAYQGAPGVPF